MFPYQLTRLERARSSHASQVEEMRWEKQGRRRAAFQEHRAAVVGAPWLLEGRRFKESGHFHCSGFRTKRWEKSVPLGRGLKNQAVKTWTLCPSHVQWMDERTVVCRGFLFADKRSVCHSGRCPRQLAMFLGIIEWFRKPEGGEPSLQSPGRFVKVWGHINQKIVPHGWGESFNFTSDKRNEIKQQRDTEFYPAPPSKKYLMR